ncbi:hypothetical protein [Streptomyces sp. NPDC054842]
MYEYEIHQTRSADLIRQADHHRMVREALRSRRAAARASAGQDTGGQAHTDRPRRHRFARVA